MNQRVKANTPWDRQGDQTLGGQCRSDCDLESEVKSVLVGKMHSANMPIQVGVRGWWLVRHDGEASLDVNHPPVLAVCNEAWTGRKSPT